MEQQIPAMWAQVGVGLLQCLLIAGGLWLMSRTGERRDRQLDLMEAGQREQSEALGKIGRALDRQGAALDRQGEVLAELLRRSAQPPPVSRPAEHPLAKPSTPRRESQNSASFLPIRSRSRSQPTGNSATYTLQPRPVKIPAQRW